MLVWQRLLVAFVSVLCYFWPESSPCLESEDPRSTQTERWDIQFSKPDATDSARTDVYVPIAVSEKKSHGQEEHM